MKTTASVLITLSLICFGILPEAEAVSPPPDGAYPRGNTAEGQSAFSSLTSGTYNTAVGFFSLENIATSNFNTGIGAGTLLANTADNNTATGAGALLSNTTGGNNTANGVFSLFDNTATGGSNTANGFAALGNNTTGNSNTATGVNALLNNITGANNTATGYQALFNNTIAFGNTATGFQALQSNTTGGSNTAIGTNALPANITGGGNTAIGSAALLNTTTGDSNTALGVSAGLGVTTATNVICIRSDGANVNNSCFIGNIRDVQTHNADAITVVIDSAGQLGTASSSARFKKEIKPMDNASKAILALKPVTFHYKGDETGTRQFGLIAEEVAAVDPNLVVRDKNGEIYTVRYEAVNAMLLNEFLKEHRKNEEQEATIMRLQNQIEALTAGLQKVSAQLEVNKAAPQTVENNQ
jgi:hypothetical protein